MTDIQIFNSVGSALKLVPITDRCKLEQEIMKTEQIHLEWSDTQNITLPLGCYVSYNSVLYYLAKPYYPQSTDNGRYTYKVDFVHEIMLLKGIPFMLYTIQSDGSYLVEPDWSYTGSVTDLVPTLQTAINKSMTQTYSIQVEEGITKAISMSFSNVDILSALNSIVEDIEAEWWIDGNVIRIGKKYLHEGGVSNTLSLTAGVEVDYPSNNDKAEFFNRFYVFGSTRNIPQDYQGASSNNIVNKRLTLSPSVHADGSMLLPKYDINGDIQIVTTPTEGYAPFLDTDGVTKYYKIDDSASGNNIFTKVLFLDDIYPRADLKVAHIATKVKYLRDDADNKIETATGYATYNVYYVQFVNSQGEVFSFNPKTYSKNLNNEYEGDVIKNLTPSIHFNSGALTGREFEICNHFSQIPQVKNDDGTDVSFSGFVTPTGGNASIFEIKFTQDGSIIIPNTGIAPVVNDEAVVFNIRMPQQYVNKGYIDLDTEAIKQIYELSRDGNEYSVKSNQVHFAQNNVGVTLGRHVHFTFNYRMIDTRVTKLTTYLDKTFNKEITFCKAIQKGSIQTILTTLSDTQEQVIKTQAEDTFEVKQARRAQAEATRELQESIFDTDGYFKDGNIKPATIETLMLRVGGKSTDFALGGFTMIPNIEGTTSNPNYISWTNGILTHYGLEVLEEWVIDSPSGNSKRLTEDDGLMYIYAKCTLYDTTMYSQGSGTIEITADKIQWNEKVETNNVYYFLIGTISSVNSSTNKRVVSLTYGSTTINGEYVKTGVLQSNNGKVKIDLNTGSIYAEDGISFVPSGSSTPKTFAEYVTETSQSITDVGNKIDNLQVGGNNVIPYSRYDTKRGLNSQMYGSPDVYSVVNDDEMGLCLEGSASIGNASACFAPFSLEPNKEYTFSFYYKMCGSTIGVINALFGHSKASFIQLMSQVGTTSNGATIVARDTEGRFFSGYNFPKDKKWHRYWVVFKVDTTITSNYSELYIRLGSNKYGASSNVRWRVAKLQLEEGNKVTSWRCSDADIETQVEEVKTGLQQQIAELETQIDNEIEYFFGNNVPTLTNEPASSWTTDELKKAHVGDVYMDETHGTTYKWVVSGGVYSWKFLENDPSALAMARATQALAEVGDKSAILYGGSEPQNYQKGDLWSRGAEYPLLICVTEGKHTTYSSSDWADAGEYIDAQARADAQTAQTTADGAVTTANNVDNRLNNLSMGGTNLFDGTEDINREVQYDYNKLTLTTAETTTEKEFVLSFDMSASSYSNECTLIFTDPRYKDNDGSWATDFYEVSSNINIGATTRTAEGKFDYFSLPNNSTFGYFCDGNYHRVWIRFKQVKDWSVVSSQYREPIKRTFVIYKNRSTDATIRIKNIKLEFGSVASAWSPSLNDTNSAISALQDMVTSLENQVDGQIEYYTYNYVPTASNIPASSWTTDKLKKEHVGDMFYCTANSLTYKWVYKDSTYQWIELTNDPSAKALKTANEALNATERKNMVIYGGNEPSTPYKQGDLWIRQGEPILIASQDSNTYLASHWVDAPTYKDTTARKDASDAMTKATTADTNAGVALTNASNAKNRADSAYNRADSAYNHATDAETNAKAYADACQRSAQSYADTQANLAKKSAMDEIDNYAYLQDAMMNASKQAGFVKNGLMLGSFIAVGSYNGDMTKTPLDPTKWNLYAGMCGEVGTDGDTIAFWAGGSPTSTNLPFRVLHNGSVRMTKAEITSGSTDGAKIQILDNAISIGSTYGTDTQILGISGNGVDNMYAIANGGNTSQNVTISAKNATKYDSSVKTIVNGSTTYAYAYSDRAEVTIPRISLINNTTSNRGVFTFGSVVFTETKGYETGYPTISGTTSYNTDSGADTWERYIIASVVDENGNEKAVFKNVSSLKGLKFVIEPNTHYYLVVTLTSQVKEKFKCKSEVSTDVVYSFKYYHSISVSSSTDNQYIYQCFNNTLYKDGMFMSKDSDHWLGLSAHGNGSYSMFKLVNGNNSGFNVASNRLEFLNKNASGLIASPIPFVIWCGYAEWTSGTSVNVNTHTIASVTLSFEFVSNAHYKLKITGGATFSGKKLSVLFSAEDGYETMVSFTHSASDISSNGQAFITFKSIVGTQKEYNWWRGDVSWLNGSSAVMKKIGITIIAY